MRLLYIFLFFFIFIGNASSSSIPAYEVTIKDGIFSPSFLSVEKKQRFKIHVKNIGTSPAEFENLSLRVEKVLGPDVASFVIVPPLKPGNYYFIDEFHPDFEPLKIIVKD